MGSISAAIMSDVGIDLAVISRFEGKDDHYAKCFLTPAEFELYGQLQPKRKATFLASRWACKEAIFKATQDIHFTDYSILNEKSGKPYVADHPEMKVSISHDGDFVVAIVITD